MSSIITRFSDFSKFLLTGSFNPALEKKIDTLVRNRVVDIKDFIETEFKSDVYEFKDIIQLQMVIRNASDYQEVNKRKDESSNPYTCTIHNQVSLTCPNFKYYNKIYDQFFSYGRLGQFIMVAIAITYCAISVIKNRSITAIPLKSIALLSMVIGFLWARTRRAGFLYDITNFHNLPFHEFSMKAKDIKSKREVLYKIKPKQRGESYSVSDKQAVSSRESEIIQLLDMHERSEKTTSQPNSEYNTILEVLGNTYDVTKVALITEKKAINAYLLELSAADWIQMTVGAFKEVISKGQWASRDTCVTLLEGIQNRFSLLRFLSDLPPNQQETVIGHLKTYLDARKNRKVDAVLPTKGQLFDLVKPTKEYVRYAMLEIINKCSIPLNEIPKDDPFWAGAGFEPQTLEWVKPKSE